jgi:hypothetical protein
MGDAQVIERLLAVKQRLETKRNAAKRDMEVTEQRLQAITTTLDVLREEFTVNTREAAVEEPQTEELVKELRKKKTQLQALVAIARRNSGILYTKGAKELLMRSGLMKVSTKNGSNILYNVINRSERFENVGVGKYRLKEAASMVPSSIANRMESVEQMAVFPSKPI